VKKLIGSLGVASLAVLALAATVAAAGPGSGQGQRQVQGQAPAGTQVHAQGAQPAAGDVVASILGLTTAQVHDLRHSGLSLAQIAAKQGVDPQKLVDALVAQWSTRIDHRVSTGALTAAQATALKSQLAVRARDMVYTTTLGGMRGAAVGAGPGQGQGGGRGAGQGRASGAAGAGAGSGTCDGTGAMGGGRVGATQP
jgi:hypothetical protein